MNGLESSIKNINPSGIDEGEPPCYTTPWQPTISTCTKVHVLFIVHSKAIMTSYIHESSIDLEATRFELGSGGLQSAALLSELDYRMLGIKFHKC